MVEQSGESLCTCDPVGLGGQGDHFQVVVGGSWVHAVALVATVGVAVLDVCVQYVLRWRRSMMSSRSVHSRRNDPIQRSAKRSSVVLAAR